MTLLVPTWLDPTPETTHDVFSADHAPVLTITRATRSTVRSLDASGYLERQHEPGQQQPTMFAEPRGHCPDRADRGLAVPDRARCWPCTWTSCDPTTGAGRWRPRSSHPGDPAARAGRGPPSWLLWELDPDRGTGTCDARVHPRRWRRSSG